jgi:hypothetical protein
MEQLAIPHSRQTNGGRADGSAALRSNEIACLSGIVALRKYLCDFHFSVL